jgi:hypothetical protein
MNKPVIKKVNGEWRAIAPNSYRARQLLWTAISFARLLNQKEGIKTKGKKSSRKIRRILKMHEADFESAMDSVESGWTH